MATLNWPDRLVFNLTNVWLLLRHPRVSERFWRYIHRPPFFATPRGHGEMVHWRKFVDHNPLFIELTDKLRAKQWAVRTVPALRVAKVVWQGTRPEDVPDAFLVPGYVIKTNHASGYNYFPHREKWDRARFNAYFAERLARPYWQQAQWAYLFVTPQIYVEELVGNGEGLWEMTFRSHNGVVSAYYVATNQKTPLEQGALFSGDDRRMPPVIGWQASEHFPDDFVLPAFVETAKQAAARLSIGIDYARMDLMSDGTDIFFCEATIYPQSGFGVEERAHIAGLVERAWLEAIDVSWFLTTPQSWPMSLYANAFRRWVARRRQELAEAGPA